MPSPNPGRRPPAGPATSSGPSPVTLERRANDFQGRTTQTLYQGCCCCCCLHWIGAAIGGGIGMPLGWISASKRATNPTYPGAKNKILLIGLIVGVVVSAVAFMLLAFVPNLVFLFIGASMMLGALIARKGGEKTVDPAGIYCPRCQTDLRGSGESGRCPRCGMGVDPQWLGRGMNFGGKVAWRAAWVGFVASSAGTAMGYLIMWLMSQV